MRLHALHPGAIQGQGGIKFCHLATLTTGRSGKGCRRRARRTAGTATAPRRRPERGSGIDEGFSAASAAAGARRACGGTGGGRTASCCAGAGRTGAPPQSPRRPRPRQLPAKVASLPLPRPTNRRRSNLMSKIIVALMILSENVDKILNLIGLHPEEVKTIENTINVCHANGTWIV